MSLSEINDAAVNQTLDQINKLNNQEEVNKTLSESVYSDQVVADLFISFHDFFWLLHESHGTLSKFWTGDIDLVKILLNLINASREGNWPLHLFSIQEMIPCCFGRIPVDQTIEKTIKKDTQTAGDTKGFSTKTNAVEKYYITANDRANSVRQLRSMVSKENYHTKNHTR